MFSVVLPFPYPPSSQGSPHETEKLSLETMDDWSFHFGFDPAVPSVEYSSNGMLTTFSASEYSLNQDLLRDYSSAIEFFAFTCLLILLRLNLLRHRFKRYNYHTNVN